MSKRAKLLKRIRQNPKNVSPADLQTLLEMFGFTLKRTKGSHQSFVGFVGGRKTLLVIPYKHPLQESYVKQALKAIDKILKEQGESDEDE